MTEPMRHERARRLAAGRLDEALSASDEAALEVHLADCAACRATVAGFEADRLALRSMPPVEPPRDLWARTSAALEREHARHPRVVRRAPRRWGPVTVLSGGFALILVIAIVGPGLLAGRQPVPGIVNIPSGGIAGPGASSGPGVTPIAVTSQVTWVVTKVQGGLSLVTANISKVCPSGDAPDCPPIPGISRSLANLPTVPSSVVLSPSNASQAVAIGPAPNRIGTTLFVMVVPAAPAPSLAPSSSPLPGSSSPASPSPRATPAAATPTPTQTKEAASPTPSASPVEPSLPPVVSPPPAGSPAPTAAAALAILSNVTLVGDEAAYRADGQWFAFSARPAGTARGPDIYVWRAGWPAAQPITTDHGSIFSGWVDGRILASRAVPVSIDASPSPGSSGNPASSPAPGASSPPTSSPGAPAPSSSLPAPAGSVAAFGAGSAQVQPSPSGSTGLATPASYLVDPASGQATRIAGLDGWRPIVDPSDRWVAYWAGTLAFDPATGMWHPFHGQLQIASWATVSTAIDAATGAAAAHPLPFDAVTDWDIRWDRLGQHLGVWIADADNPGLGRLSLLTIDPGSGQTSSAPPDLLPPTPALRGFALKDGQLVWATPPGQDGVGSRLSVLAWTGVNAGKTSLQAIDDGALIVVP